MRKKKRNFTDCQLETLIDQTEKKEKNIWKRLTSGITNKMKLSDRKRLRQSAVSARKQPWIRFKKKKKKWSDFKREAKKRITENRYGLEKLFLV